MKRSCAPPVVVKLLDKPAEGRNIAQKKLRAADDIGYDGCGKLGEMTHRLHQKRHGLLRGERPATRRFEKRRAFLPQHSEKARKDFMEKGA